MPIKKTLSQITIPRTKGKYNLFFEAESKQSCGLPQATDTSRQRFEHVVLNQLPQFTPIKQKMLSSKIMSKSKYHWHYFDNGKITYQSTFLWSKLLNGQQSG